MLMAPLQLLAQTATLGLASATTAPGTATSLNLSLSNSASLGGLSALQFSITFPSADFSSAAVSAGAAITSQSKSLKCRSSAGRLDCMVWALNTTTLGNGVIAVVSVTPAASVTGTRTLAVTGVTGARPTGELTPAIATANGTVTVSAPPPTVSLTGLTCSPSTVSASSSTTCSVTLSGNAPSPTAVSLTSNTTRLTVPSTVTVPSGQASVSFTATTGSFTTSSTGTITATLAGVTRSVSLSLVPLPVLQSLACSPGTLFSGESASCVVTLSAAPLTAQAVSLTKDNALVSMPASVTVGAGALSASFTASVGTLSADALATVTAALNGVTRTTTLALSAPPVPVSLVCTPNVLNPSDRSSCVVRLSKAPNSSVSVAISRSSTRVYAPASVTVAAGSSSATFTATAYSVTSLTNVEVRATLNGVRVTTVITVSTRSCPCSLFDPATAVPQTESEPDTAAVELGVKFRSQIAGYVIGVRFYKGAANTGTHSGRLWTASGVQLASVTFLSETASGWQTAYFPEPVAIEANTLYVISYRAPVGRYSVNPQFFANSAFVNGPLSADASWESGGNGVYRYGSIGFPSSSYLSTNYWVDVIFNTTPSSTRSAIPMSFSAPSEGVSVSSLEAAPRPAISVPEEEYRQPGEDVTFVAASPDGRPLEAEGLPAGATYDPVAARFRWTPEPNQAGEHSVRFRDPQSSSEATTRIIVGLDTPSVLAASGCQDGVGSILGRWLGPDSDEYQDLSGNSTELAGVRVSVGGWEVPVLRVRRNRVDYACPAAGTTLESSVLIYTARGVAYAPVEGYASKTSAPVRDPKN